MIKIFKSLPKGIQRSLIVGGIGVSFALGAIFNIMDRNRVTDDYLIYVLIFAIPATIVLLIAGLWIYSGFKNDNK